MIILHYTLGLDPQRRGCLTAYATDFIDEPPGGYEQEAKGRAQHLLSEDVHRILGTNLHSLEQCEVDLKNIKLREKIIQNLN